MSSPHPDTPASLLERLRFSNSFASLGEAFFSRVQPTPLRDCRLVAVSPDAARLLDLSPDEIRHPQLAAFLTGNAPHPAAEPLAMLYAGHQFGHWVPELGDGRAILLGEVTNSAGERWELQLKGAGLTPYSRDGDGRAVLRSTIREYLCSEAMAALGIPTTRALCIGHSPEEVYRERIETGAVLLRMAPSHVRFGSFEVFYYRGQFERLRRLADHVMAHHFPGLSPGDYLGWYREVARRTADLMADWQRIGFAHGVMNTDNMSILGLTLDYGPFGFLDAFEPGFICNHSDHQGRYAFDRQPDVGLWNLSCLAQALLPILADDAAEAAEAAKAEFDTYVERFRARYAQGMRARLGLLEAREGDDALIERLLTLMADASLDYTRSFRLLAEHTHANEAPGPALVEHFATSEAFPSWHADYRQRLRAEGRDDAERRQRQCRENPKYILRNHLAQRAIEAAGRGDFSEVERLQRILSRPFDDQPVDEAYALPPPPDAPRVAISCSS
ncbi:protein adenylyltransferase SelO [Thiohalobacter sp.]|uniref:protein adenylyltransferase SelO n=1 Tax=Thiohalobacter sp. TaxID=2025948 RepID=UPI002617A7BD|nr:YdiU family protein [Thiohalobacter sp.]